MTEKTYRFAVDLKITGEDIDAERSNIAMWIETAMGRRQTDGLRAKIDATVYDATHAALIDAMPDIVTALEDLAEWAREHTSPRDTNSPHELLKAAAAAILKAKGA